MRGSVPRVTSRDRPGIRRSWGLFRAFRVEQSDPDRFYGALAADSVRLVGWHTDLTGRTVLDVGGGPGYFAEAFREQGACYLAVDPDVGEVSARGRPGRGVVLGSGLALPVRDGSVDVCFSSNVLEHVRRPWDMAGEMLRVTRPGGTVVISFTVWLGPWGGHETSPWHFVGGRFARRRYVRRHGHQPKNRFGETLFPVHVGAALRWARTCPTATLVAGYPRYHPWWARWVVRMPLLRELVTWNLVLVLRVDRAVAA